MSPICDEVEFVPMYPEIIVGMSVCVVAMNEDATILPFDAVADSENANGV